MLKKSFLTPVLAGILAVTVVGSGVGYYFEFVKDDGVKASDKTGAENNTLTVEDAAATIEAQLDKAQQIADGELEGGYSAKLTYTVPDDVSADSELSGINELSGIKDIAVGMEAKQKDKMSEMEYTIAYDSQSLLTADVVYDNENEVAYLKIPELSDAYLTGTADEIEAYLESMLDDSGYSSYEAETEDSSVDTDAFENIDTELLTEDIQGYVDAIKENAPEPTDGEDRTVTADGESLTLTTKTYTITEANAENILNAVVEKGKSDETLKELYLALGETEESYNEIWDSLSLDDTEYSEGESDETVTVEVYYYDDEEAGWSISAEDEEYYLISASDGTKQIIDGSFDSDDSETLTVTGLVTIDGDTFDGDMTAEYTSVSSYDYLDDDATSSSSTTTSTTEIVISYDNLIVNEDTLKGSVSMSCTSDDSEIAKLVFDFDNSGDDFDMSVDVSLAGESYGKVGIVTQTTDASDITVPTGTMYSISDEAQLEEYYNGCDIDGWEEAVKNALVEELYNSIFGSSTDDAITYDYDLYSDYDYDYYTFDDDYSTEVEA